VHAAHTAHIRGRLRKKKWTRGNGSSLCKIKAVALSLIDPFADQFIDQSHFVSFLSELFHTDNLNLGYSELLAEMHSITA